jgi:predicted DNA-binding transcriptional regulator AlpA
MCRLLTTEEAAERIGWVPNTLEKKRVTGAGPKYLKLGRSVRYRESDLENWLSARLIQSTSEARCEDA